MRYTRAWKDGTGRRGPSAAQLRFAKGSPLCQKPTVRGKNWLRTAASITPLSNALLGTAATSISGYPMRKLESLFLYQRAIAETPSVRLPRVLAAVITDCLTMRYMQIGARSTLTRLQQAK